MESRSTRTRPLRYIEPDWRLRSYALGLVLVASSVPLVHLYVDVALTTAELAVHAADVALAALAAVAIVDGAITLWQRSLRWQLPTRRVALVSSAVAALGAALLLQHALHDVLPATSGVRAKHVAAGYGDMAVRTLPIAAVVVLAVALSIRGRWLEAEVARLRGRMAARRPDAAAIDDHAAPLVLRHEGADVRVHPSEVLAVSAEENYCRFLLANGRDLLVRMTLREAEAALPGSAFGRVHRSHVVALDRIVSLRPQGRRYEAAVAGSPDEPAGTGVSRRIPVSRSRAPGLRRRIGSLPAASVDA